MARGVDSGRPFGVSSIDLGSFKDPDGGIVYKGKRVYRYFNAAGAAKFDALAASGLLDSLVSQQRVISVSPASHEAHTEIRSMVPGSTLIVEHPRIPFISYCYEWPFEMLKAAALMHLEVLLAALEQGFILKDATPYNIQFVGARPILIDIASFEPYQPGQPWIAYNQFCRLFLNPLLLQALMGVRFQPWLRGSMTGIAPADLGRLLSWRNKMKPGVFTNVLLQAWLERKFTSWADLAGNVGASQIPRKSLVKLITRARSIIASLNPGYSGSSWVRYGEDNSYSEEDRVAKDSFVRSALEAQSPEIVWDLGCNTGRYTLMAAEYAEYVVAMDSDPESVGRLYHQAAEAGSQVLPLVVDLLDPSPERGWSQLERRGIIERSPADTVLALALVHHLAVSGNIPLGLIVGWLARIGRACIVEFVPKDDPALQSLLRWRQDVFNDYSQTSFEKALGRHFMVARQCTLPGSGRVLYSCLPRPT